jgi:beta-glucosidase
MTPTLRCIARPSRIALCAAVLALVASLPLSAQNPQAKIAPLPADPQGEAFVQDLLSKMTLDEKLGQMTQEPLNQAPSMPASVLAREGKVGSFLFITHAKEINRLQHLAVEQSRLHIPLLFGFDVIHGFRTIYPVPIAMAASWDPAVAERAQSMAAREASATGIQWAFGPMVDIARDPRWGRIMEGAGEDPFLGSKMAAAQVRGFQGEKLGAPGHILASVKHFAGYGAAVGGRDYEESNISDEQLWNVYLPPFRAALQAGAGAIMCAYMDLNGVPATGNRWLLHDVLRDTWGFQGFVVSDWESVKSLTTHGFSANAEDAAVRGVNAGVDMEMTSTTFRDNLSKAVASGAVSPATIDTAVHDILMIKWRMGLFQNPYVDPAKTDAQLVNAEQRSATRKAATQTAVLLRNEHQTLPIAKAVKSIAVIGPLADSKPDILGSWSLGSHPDEAVTVLEGMRNKFGADKVAYATGVEIEREQASIFDGQFQSPKPKMHTDKERADEFQHALELIKKSDVAVLVLGELQSMSGERASRQSLDLPGKQEELLEAAVATGRPVVVVLLNARPLDLTWASEHVPAILEAWYPGTEGGNAIADLIAGDAIPGGKLPMTWPRNVGQVPIYYAHTLSQIAEEPNTRYWDGTSAPLYPFGYGLSYTSFAFEDLKISHDSIPSAGTLEVSVDVENKGTRDGEEVVQMYTHQRAGSASRPVRELKGFTKVSLKAGERKTITLQLDTNDLGFWSPTTHHWSIEPGTFDLWVGEDATAKEHTTFSVTPSS